MDRALVVLNETEIGKALLREAADLAVGVDAELVLLSLLTEGEYEHDIDVLTQIDRSERTTTGGSRSFEEISRPELAQEEGEQMAESVLGGAGVDYRVVGEVVEGRMADVILEVAGRLDCDHVFLVGGRQSRVGKAIFGDVAQEVILDFDGPVTVQV